MTTYIEYKVKLTDGQKSKLAGCLENDDLENEDLRPRKRRPRKQRPRKRRPKKNRGEWGALKRSVRNAPSPDKTKIAYS